MSEPTVLLAGLTAEWHKDDGITDNLQRLASGPRTGEILTLSVARPGAGGDRDCGQPAQAPLTGRVHHRIPGDRGRRVGQGAKESQLFGTAGAGLGVVDDEKLACGAADDELLAAKREVSDLRVVEAGRHALAVLHVVPGLQLPESLAG